MKNQTIASSKQRLDALFAQIRLLRTLGNPQIESQWATYLCIRVSGLLETSIQSIYVAYSADKAHPNVAKYIDNNLRRNRSLSMSPVNIVELVGSFNDLWRSQLEDYLSGNGRKEAIESVINIRHSAAHGGTTSVSYVHVKEYYIKIWEVIEFLESQCMQ